MRVSMRVRVRVSGEGEGWEGEGEGWMRVRQDLASLDGAGRSEAESPVLPMKAHRRGQAAVGELGRSHVE